METQTQNKAIGQRTGLDFSKHELAVTKTDGLLIHHLKMPNTVIHNIKFINTNGRLIVTGDYGNWLFCREFHPSDRYDAFVSEQYWLEKLKINSCQDPYLYDAEGTEKEIREMLNDEDRDLEPIHKLYLEKLLLYVDDELEYKYYAFRQHPNDWDLEDTPHVKKLHVQLPYVFDAFDEICRRLK